MKASEGRDDTDGLTLLWTLCITNLLGKMCLQTFRVDEVHSIEGKGIMYGIVESLWLEALQILAEKLLLNTIKY